MLKIHLAQINYNPAYYDSPIDFLEEPAFLNENDSPVGKLRSFNEVKNFLSDSKTFYIQYIKSKLIDIATWSGERKANILAFPEYSVPFQVLPDLLEIAKKYSIVIIAGTHRVPFSEDAKDIYKSLGLAAHLVPTGAACSPILLPDGTVEATLKLKRSKWEANLLTPTNEAESVTFKFEGDSIRLAVVPCIDSLHTEVLGNLWSKDETSPHLIICPSLSPSIELFHHIGSLAISRDTLFAYVNSAAFGETFFALPPTWAPYLKGQSGNVDTLPRNVEAILEIEVEPQQFFTKRGSIQNAPICTHPLPFPIIYTSDTRWLPAYDLFKTDLIEWLTTSENRDAIEWLDNFLTDESSQLPDLLVQKLKHLRHSIIPLYDGNIESINSALEFVRINNKVENTHIVWAKRVYEAIRILGSILVRPETQTTDELLECLRSLKATQRKLPSVTADQDTQLTIAKPETSLFMGEDDLVEAFQNRGKDLDLVRSYFANPDNRVVLVTGAVGIGKSDFLNLMFKKTFVDWELIRVGIPKGGNVARLVADIAYSLGMTIDVDSLALASHNIFRQKVRQLMKVFYSKPKRALVLDDLQQIIADGNARAHRHLETLFEEAANPVSFAGGRVFLVSSAWAPNSWFYTKGVSHLHLRGLQDMYIRRIIEYHMRRTNIVNDESIPEPNQALLDLVKGHPLSARLVVDALQNKNLGELSDELLLSKLTENIAKELLSRIELPADLQEMVIKLSVFRIPLRKMILLSTEGINIDENQFNALASLSIISYDGHAFEMHEAVRRFYQAKIGNAEQRKQYHKLAATYYQKLYEDLPVGGKKDPSIVAELVHHLTLSGDIQKAKDFRLLVVSEIKPTARQIYREFRDYPRALSLYRLLADVTPDDTEVLAYLGRCYARLQQWDDSDKSFRQAIDIALKIGKPAWWIFRDWGHIKARFEHFQQAEELLLQAKDKNPNDASIKASLAYMKWRQGAPEEARELFEDGYNNNPNNRYILTFYPKLLNELGESDYAKSLRERLALIETSIDYREPNEYELEEYDD